MRSISTGGCNIAGISSGSCFVEKHFQPVRTRRTEKNFAAGANPQFHGAAANFSGSDNSDLHPIQDPALPLEPRNLQRRTRELEPSTVDINPKLCLAQFRGTQQTSFGPIRVVSQYYF
jgi:hypothetical protein